MELKKGLSLCLIVGPGESKELTKLLESVTPKDKEVLFEDICVTHACTEPDPEVLATANKYTTNISNFTWVQDFSAARNFNFSQAKCTYILWVDADDVIKPSEYDKILKLKKDLLETDKCDMVLMDYVYFHDDNDNPVVVLPRERVVKNCEKTKWYDPIHEYIDMCFPHERIMRTNIKIDHYRTKPYDPSRNIPMLKKEYDKGNASARIKFYYGKELADNGNWNEAVPVLEEVVQKGDGFVDNLTVACTRLSRYYFHMNKNLNNAKMYALRGIHFNSGYAENYVTLGEIFQEENNIDVAIKYYKEALNKKLDGGMSQVVDYYGFIPASKLAMIYYTNRNYSDALKYCDIAIQHRNNDQKIQELKKMIQNELNKLSGDNTVSEEDLKKIKGFFDNIGYTIEVVENTVDSANILLHKARKIKVAWLIPFFNEEDPATRIRRLQSHIELEKKGIKSKFIINYITKSVFEVRNEIDDANVVVFTMYTERDFEIAKHLKELGIKCVFDHCEAIFDEGKKRFMDVMDAIVSCSTRLTEMTIEKGFKNAITVKDPIEFPKGDRPCPNYNSGRERPHAVFVGMGGNSFLISQVYKDVFDKAGYETVIISEWADATKRWTIDTWGKDMVNEDIVFCPQRVDIQPAKSNVKVTTAMALGMPVVASRIKSYEEVIKQGENGYIFDSKEDLYNILIELKNPEKRKKIGESAQKSITEYMPDKIADKWIEGLSDVVNNVIKKQSASVEIKEEPNQDMVDLIIPNYNNLPYLKMFINSILLNTAHPFHIIISDSGSNADMWEYLRTLKGITVLGSPNVRKTFSEACNAGIEASRAKYFMTLNSDLIVSKGWLTNLVTKMNSIPRLAACGVLSNCDRGWLHGAPGKTEMYDMKLPKSGLELIPGMKREQIEPVIEELYEFMAKSNNKYKDKFVKQPWVAAYATIFARCAINEIGVFDTIYRNGCEDWDLCNRLSKGGYVIGQAIDSFIFHFGGISRGAYQDTDREVYDKEDKENHIKMRVKWAKPKIAIWTGPAHEPWNKKKVDEGMAGSETWAAYLAEEFVKKGFYVSLYNDLLVDDKAKPLYQPVKGTDGAVIYRHYDNLLDDLKYDYIDYFISSRSLQPYYYNLHAGKKFVMIHDIWLSQDPDMDLLSWQVYKYAYLSEWHKNFLLQHHKNMPSDKMFMTSNGVNIDRYMDVDSFTKKNQMIYSSSPDRGLYQLLLMFPKIKAQVPDFKLFIAYGFFNWESSAKQRGDAASLALMDKIKGLIGQSSDIVYLDRINKDELALYQKESKVWLYPTWFVETQCITAIENGLSKNALLSTNLGGLTTTIGNSGILLDGGISMTRDIEYDKEYTDKFVEESIKLLKDETYRLTWADKVYKKMSKEYSWSSVADKWIEEFNK